MNKIRYNRKQSENKLEGLLNKLEELKILNHDEGDQGKIDIFIHIFILDEKDKENSEKKEGENTEEIYQSLVYSSMKNKSISVLSNFNGI